MKITVELDSTDAAIILYALRTLSDQLDHDSPDLDRVTQSYERQLPATISRLVDAKEYPT